jgi:hypothetical protein
MYKGIEFFTATCLNWQMLLEPDDRKDVCLWSVLSQRCHRPINRFLPLVGVVTDQLIVLYSDVANFCLRSVLSPTDCSATFV